jgi:hypothetical protein
VTGNDDIKSLAAAFSEAAADIAAASPTRRIAKALRRPSM